MFYLPQSPRIIIFVLYMSLFLLCLYYQGKTQISIGFKCILITLLSFMIVFRSPLMDDYENYLYLFQSWKNNTSQVAVMEPAKFLILSISSTFFHFLFLYGICALVSLFLAISYSEVSLYVIIAHLSTFFIKHEMVQIRAACAVAIFLYSLKWIIEKDFKRYFLLIILASMFHFTAIFYFPMYFLSCKKFNRKFWTSIIFLSFCFSIIGLRITKLITFIPVPFIQNYYNRYVYMQSELGGKTLNIFNIKQFQCLLLWLIIAFYWPRIERKTKNTDFNLLTMKVFAISILIQPLFADLTTVALRISELYRTVIIFILPLLLYIPKKKIYGQISFILFCIFFFFFRG